MGQIISSLLAMTGYSSLFVLVIEMLCVCLILLNFDNSFNSQRQAFVFNLYLCWVGLRLHEQKSKCCSQCNYNLKVSLV